MRKFLCFPLIYLFIAPCTSCTTESQKRESNLIHSLIKAGDCDTVTTNSILLPEDAWCYAFMLHTRKPISYDSLKNRAGIIAQTVVDSLLIPDSETKYKNVIILYRQSGTDTIIAFPSRIRDVNRKEITIQRVPNR